jgi:hypothetical protein
MASLWGAAVEMRDLVDEAATQAELRDKQAGVAGSRVTERDRSRR